MNGKKIMVQTAVCLAIMGAVHMDFVAEIPNSDELTAMASINYSAADIHEAGGKLWKKVKTLPDAITGAVIEANSLNLYGEPLQATDSNEKLVYASRGGNVEKSGISSEYGLYIIINHGDECCNYGNLNKIYAAQGDRVKKGDVIGVYCDDSDKEFYYEVK